MADEKQRKKWREASKRYADKNREKIRKNDRERQKKKSKDNPVWREEKNYKRRADGMGFTKRQWEQMFDEQGRACAICGTTESGSKKGWNLDHCHKTKTVRFILCTHCNRGLGGFKDKPDLLRRAADMLEEFNQRRQDNGEFD